MKSPAPLGAHPGWRRPHAGLRRYAELAPLRPGDRVALVSPSSHQGRANAHGLGQALEILHGWGLAVEPPEEAQHLYLAGPDDLRAGRFQLAYTDPAVRALFIARGGYGASRMLPHLDPAPLAAAGAKPVVGFSDATALFAWLHRMLGTQALHAPCLAAPSLLDAPRRAESLAALRRALFERPWAPRFEADVLHWPRGGAPEPGGPVLGGCLSVWLTTLGTPWEVPARGAILFFEDTDEAPYRVDRLFTHLRAAGRLEGVRALVLGHFLRCDGDPPGLLEQVLRDLFGDAPFPVVRGLPAGHGDPNLPLPLGRRARLRLAGSAAAAGRAVLTFE
ncbi:MAG: LD-carboxypeptidase [Candidatus Lambdaproteobacteria bacterium]|nr:LD-carboxypeptidase [Candidatus Lambdaproteobacteria bacterium]